MSDTKVVATSGSVFFELLTVLFIGLKLTGYITWSWWWVLSPLWLPLAVALWIAAIVGILVGIVSLFN